MRRWPVIIGTFAAAIGMFCLISYVWWLYFRILVKVFGPVQ